MTKLEYICFSNVVYKLYVTCSYASMNFDSAVYRENIGVSMDPKASIIQPKTNNNIFTSLVYEIQC